MQNEIYSTLLLVHLFDVYFPFLLFIYCSHIVDILLLLLLHYYIFCI